MNRRDLISAIGMTALSRNLAWAEGLFPLAELSAPSASGDARILRPFSVHLPENRGELPLHSQEGSSRPSFSIRGIKGYAWSPEQYLSEIPVMAKYRLNFLMNCYSSFWELGPHGAWVNDRPMNFWYRPLPDDRRRMFEEVIHSCQQHGISFCLSINPNLKSDRPFDYADAKDLDALWQHYAWAQGLGVKWFNISLDDIDRNISAAGHAALVDAMLKRLRSKDPEAQLNFCPTWYAGTGEAEVETSHILGRRTKVPRPGQTETPGMTYIKALAEELHPDVWIFWTGPEVESPSISAAQASRYKALIKHRVLLWDNYPVNDQMPALDLGPLRGRDVELGSVLDGYMSNSMGYENEANRLPLLTIADYLWNSRDYDPDRSIGQSILHLADTKAKRDALRSFVELYPGRLWDGANHAQWNSLRQLFSQYLANGRRDQAKVLLAKADATSTQMQTLFPDSWSSGSRVLELDVRAMRSELGMVKEQPH